MIGRREIFGLYTGESGGGSFLAPLSFLVSGWKRVLSRHPMRNPDIDRWPHFLVDLQDRIFIYSWLLYFYIYFKFDSRHPRADFRGLRNRADDGKRVKFRLDAGESEEEMGSFLALVPLSFSISGWKRVLNR
ncbi:hypothetical protein CDAR_518021 [Caerostris darwini]|uniref:Uncharacterized protein n=1 Tax=Caerostris darwini TaxID=1538125 RepID=A0AAV4QUA5_9ARAC|nr:hypothetical protein CDAR_518021 [Caerostris darwini]